MTQSCLDSNKYDNFTSILSHEFPYPKEVIEWGDKIFNCICMQQASHHMCVYLVMRGLLHVFITRDNYLHVCNKTPTTSHVCVPCCERHTACIYHKRQLFVQLGWDKFWSSHSEYIWNAIFREAKWARQGQDRVGIDGIVQGNSFTE